MAFDIIMVIINLAVIVVSISILGLSTGKIENRVDVLHSFKPFIALIVFDLCVYLLFKGFIVIPLVVVYLTYELFNLLNIIDSKTDKLVLARKFRW